MDKKFYEYSNLLGYPIVNAVTYPHCPMGEEDPDVFLVYAENEPPLFSEMVLQYFNQYDNLNILLKPSHAYHNEGRLQTEAEASRIGDNIENMLITHNIPYIVLPTKQALENILEILKEVGILWTPMYLQKKYGKYMIEI